MCGWMRSGLFTFIFSFSSLSVLAVAEDNDHVTGIREIHLGSCSEVSSGDDMPKRVFSPEEDDAYQRTSTGGGSGSLLIDEVVKISFDMPDSIFLQGTDDLDLAYVNPYTNKVVEYIEMENQESLQRNPDGSFYAYIEIADIPVPDHSLIEIALGFDPPNEDVSFSRILCSRKWYSGERVPNNYEVELPEGVDLFTYYSVGVVIGHEDGEDTLYQDPNLDPENESSTPLSLSATQDLASGGGCGVMRSTRQKSVIVVLLLSFFILTFIRKKRRKYST
jgi:hypothetical protein